MNDAQKGYAGQGCTIQSSNHIIQRLVCGLPSNVHGRLLIESQSAA
jgi:hypothetical protein